MGGTNYAFSQSLSVADAIGCSYYPIDIHQNDGSIDIRPLEDGIVATLPYGALLPQGSEHLIVAGRCIAGDQEAHSAYHYSVK